jgi:hypothetical protein
MAAPSAAAICTPSVWVDRSAEGTSGASAPAAATTKFGCSPGCLEGFVAVARLLPSHRNDPIIGYGKRPSFDWKYRLVGETTPDKVLVPAVESVDLPSLLAELEAAEAGAVIPDEGTKPVPPRKPDGPTVCLEIQKGQAVLKIPLSIGELAQEHPGDAQSAEDTTNKERIQ